MKTTNMHCLLSLHISLCPFHVQNLQQTNVSLAVHRFISYYTALQKQDSHLLSSSIKICLPFVSSPLSPSLWKHMLVLNTARSVTADPPGCDRGVLGGERYIAKGDRTRIMCCSLTDGRMAVFSLTSFHLPWQPPAPSQSYREPH